MSNNIIIVAETLNVGTTDITVRFYDTTTLKYLNIVSVVGLTDFSILTDTLTIAPTSFSATLNVEVIFTSSSVSFPVYFKTEYEKDTSLSGDIKSLYPSNMFKWDNDNPKYDEVRALNDIVSEVFAEVGDLIPVTREFHKVFGEYVSNQFIGLAMAMAVEQYIKGMEETEWLTIMVEDRQSFSQIVNFKDKCTTLGAVNTKGLYPTILDSDGNLCRLRNGGLNGHYCRYNLTIRVGELAPARVLDYFIFDSVIPTQMVDAAPTASFLDEDFITELFRKKNMLEIAGLRANMEVVYQHNPLDISDLGLEFKLPAKSKVPLQEYLPVEWISNQYKGVFKMAIKFDGMDYIIRTVSREYLTFDSPLAGEVMDRGLVSE